MNAWWNDYIGLPYLEKGRGREGLDCWGLVRLVYAEQFATELPSLSDEYDLDDRGRIAELIAAKREGWVRTDTPRSGDVVLLSILGAESHIGIVTTPGSFLHVREGQDSVIERMDSTAWKHRVRGVYRYTEGASVSLSACPHPLKTYRIDEAMPPGLSLMQMVEHLRETQGVPLELAKDGVISVEGQYIPRTEWESTVPAPGSRIEYRAVVRGSGVGKMIGMLAVAAFAWWAAPAIIGLGGVNLAATLGSTGLGLLQAGISAGINLVGGLLLNSIFPTRPANSGSLSGPKAMNLLQGGSNNANPYGAFPVVLGRYRYTPVAGATTYVETTGSTSYLRMLLVWGYGPLQVSDLRIGDTPLSSFDEVEYETLNGWDDTPEDKAHFNSLYSKDVTQDSPGVTLTQADGYTYRTLSGEVDRITVSLNFPQGLFGMSSSSGETLSRRCNVSIGVRQVGESSWAEVAETIPARTISLSPAYSNVDNDAELEPVYRWTRLSLDKHNQIIRRDGAFTTNPAANPSGTLLARLQADNYGVSAVFDRLPVLGAEEEELYQICTYGNTVYQTLDLRGSQGLGSVTGCALTLAGLSASLAAGTVTRSQVETVYLTKKTKTAFSHNVSFYVPHGQYEVRVARTNDNSGMDNPSYDTCVLQTITGYANNKPFVPQKPMAMTAIRIKATNQLNGSVEGITGTVQTICKDYDHATGTWIVRPTRNPASILRHVLQHPGNAKRLPDSRINLTALADWHNYCRSNGFMFDHVITAQQSLDDVLRDIAAAGRASPTWVDGLRTVIIDRERTGYAQFFAPHNSWGFEGARALPKLPHGFRVQFANSAKGYQPDERIVYNDGYSAANATLLEGLTLPGVTSAAIVHKHARFHLAQIKLRPESYTLYADWEHLICTRGDLVKVTHDVPMWGLGTGRIKEYLSATSIQIDESWPMDAGKQYTVRIRLENGTSITRTVAAVAQDGYYDTLTLTSSVTTTQGAPGNLCLFGELGEESVDLIVQSIEPAENMSARLTFVDYSPAIYDSDTEVIPAFDSQITKPPTLLQLTVSEKPTISRIISDESVMSRLSPGKYAYAISVGFTNPKTLPKRVTHIEGQLDFAEDTTTDWQTSHLVPIQVGAVVFANVQEGDTYRLRMRYVDDQGRTGPWTAIQTHTVAGKINPPSKVTGLRYWFADTALTTATITLDWDDSVEVDVEKYEVSNEVRTVTLKASTFTEQASWIGGRIYSVVAIDAAGNRSDPATIYVTKYAPNSPARFRSNVVDNNVLLYWDSPAVTSLPLSTFELRRGTTWAGAEVIGRKSGGFTSVFEMSPGTKTYWLAAIDTDNNYSDPVSLSVLVNEPPDFVLHGSFNSTLNGTLSSAIIESGGVLLPVDTTSTWATHFTSKGWTSPADQIAAGYQQFIQPSSASGYYEETFDIGTVLAGSKVSVTFSGVVVSGSVAMGCTIYTSSNGSTWTTFAGVTEAYATSFRYIKVRLTATPTDDKGLYRLTSLAVRADVKLKNDGGTASAVSTDAGGTVVNFNKPFIDITSLSVTPQGTTQLTAVVDFTDAPNPTSFKVLLFNSSGARVSGTVYWSAKGY